MVIGRALMAGPTVLVLDEPSVGLAPRRVGEIFTALGGLRAGKGLAILLVEHNTRAAFRVAGRVLLMDRGRVLAAGTPSSPATTACSIFRRPLLHLIRLSTVDAMGRATGFVPPVRKRVAHDGGFALPCDRHQNEHV